MRKYVFLICRKKFNCRLVVFYVRLCNKNVISLNYYNLINQEKKLGNIMYMLVKNNFNVYMYVF